MSTDEMKANIDGAIGVLQLGIDHYPVFFGQKLIEYLKTIDDTDILMLSSLLSYDKDQLKKDLDNSVKILNALNQLFGTNQAQRIVNFLTRLKERTILLKMMTLIPI